MATQTTHSDFVTATLSGTGDTETKVGTINVTGGSTLKQIMVANRLGVGTIYGVRLDFAGIKTPQKYVLPTIYDSVGTEVQPQAMFSTPPIDINYTLPANVSTVDVYATADTASTKCAVGLVWV